MQRCAKFAKKQRPPLGQTRTKPTRTNADSPDSSRNHGLLWAPLLAIGAAAFAAEIPFFFLGTPSGHDFEFHLYSWLDVVAQWRRGIFLPRWAALAHFGYGEPTFIFYPPSSWTLGALLSVLLPWTTTPSVYIWIVLVAAGSSMFLLARRWFARRDAMFAAVFYAVNPYHIVSVYWRSSFAELLAACLIPLLLLLVIEAAEEQRNVVAPLGLLLAAAWLTNAPAAVMIHYSLVLLIAWFAWQKHSARLLLVGAGAIALGACLSAFYLLPAIYEQNWVNIAEAVSAGSRPADNFLFIHTTDADHDAFNRIISWIAILEMALTALAAVMAREWRKSKPDLWRPLLVWAAVCGMLMFSISGALWRILPKLQFMQFPWRWLLCLSAVFTIFLVAGMRQWWLRVAVCAGSLVVIVLLWHRVQAPWWDNAADLREMQDNVVTGAGYEGVDEYTPIGADPAAVDHDARNATVAGPASATIHVQRWDAESKSFTADMSAADQLALRLFPYPAWRVEVNGHVVQTEARAGTGQMLIPVEVGMNQVEIKFVRTWDRTAGAWTSVITALGLLFVVMRGNQRSDRPRQEPSSLSF